MKKINSLVIIVLLGISNTALAAPDMFQPIIDAINTAYNNASTWVYDQTYPSNVTFQHTIAANTTTTQITADNKTVTVTPTQAATLTAKQKTADSITNSLTQFSYAVHQLSQDQIDIASPKKIKTAQGDDFSNYLTNNSMKALTTTPPKTSQGSRLFASDTLSFDLTLLPADFPTNQRASVTPPATINNKFLDFSSLITPIAYTSDEQIDVGNFLKYATQSTQDLTTGVDFNSLERHPAVVAALKTDPIYQNYMFTVRSVLALRSITLNAFNYLIAERTPINNLGTAIGLNNQSASPLQVETYQATHRIEDPNWYKTVLNASPATVQRETLIVLAEIEKQNYQAHLDRERLLSILTALNIQMSASSETAIAQSASKLNSDIQQQLQKIQSDQSQKEVDETKNKKPT